MKKKEKTIWKFDNQFSDKLRLFFVCACLMFASFDSLFYWRLGNGEWREKVKRSKWRTKRANFRAKAAHNLICKMGCMKLKCRKWMEIGKRLREKESERSGGPKSRRIGWKCMYNLIPVAKYFFYSLFSFFFFFAFCTLADFARLYLDWTRNMWNFQAIYSYVNFYALCSMNTQQQKSEMIKKRENDKIK